jgi:hypothetical protein
MPRIYHKLGEDRRRGVHVTALFTVAERERLEQAARVNNVAMSVFIHNLVIERLSEPEPAP